MVSMFSLLRFCKTLLQFTVPYAASDIIVLKGLVLGVESYTVGVALTVGVRV